MMSVLLLLLISQCLIYLSGSYRLFIRKYTVSDMQLASSPEGMDDSTRALMLNAISDVTVLPEKVGSDVVSSIKVKKPKKEPRKSVREMTGYKYSDKDGTYDVPIITEHKWYRVNVRKASEKKLYEQFTGMLDARWRAIVIDAFYPQSTYVSFKGKNIELKTKPMIPGLLYLKTQMGPDVADALEKVAGIYGFTKTMSGIVIPLLEEEAAQLELMKTKAPASDLNTELKLIKREEYVSVVSGEHAGRYGIVMGARAGKIEVCLRSDYKDDWDMINVVDLRYLEHPPEKKWKEMTAKEAVESLMAKDPHNPTIKSLKKQGLLEEILYPEGRKQNTYLEGRHEGGKSQSSISKVSKEPQDKTFQSFVDDVSKRVSERLTPDSGSDEREKTYAGATSSSSSANKQLSWASSGAGFDELLDANRIVNRESKPSNDFEDVDSFIADLLNDLDGKGDAGEAEDVGRNWDKGDSQPALNKKFTSNARTPKMEDYTSFEDYLDALVNFEKNAPAPVSGPKSTSRGAGNSNGYAESNGMASSESAAIDESLLDLLGSNVEVSKSTKKRAAPNAKAEVISEKANVSEPKKKKSVGRSTTPSSPTISSGESKQASMESSISFDDELDAFFKNLENDL
jgi:transcription antitermination factor NusG